VNSAWRSLSDEIARWRDAGRAADFWWRDDDAARPDPALARLLALSTNASVPLALAVVPLGADPALLAGLGDTDAVCVLQHGTDHRNRAVPQEKKTEFSAAEPQQAAMARLVTAREQLRVQAGMRFIPVLVPPWNRLPKPLLPHIAAAGYRGLSQYGDRLNQYPVKGLKQVNTHVDIIAWNSGRGFAGESEVLEAALRHLSARRTGSADPAEPTGFLTHHAVHDEAAWDFLRRLFETTHAIPGAEWRHAEELFHVS
jgi:hypothetical protein